MFFFFSCSGLSGDYDVLDCIFLNGCTGILVISVCESSLCTVPCELVLRDVKMDHQSEFDGMMTRWCINVKLQTKLILQSDATFFFIYTRAKDQRIPRMRNAYTYP